MTLFRDFAREFDRARAGLARAIEVVPKVSPFLAESTALWMAILMDVSPALAENDTERAAQILAAGNYEYKIDMLLQGAKAVLQEEKPTALRSLLHGLTCTLNFQWGRQVRAGVCSQCHVVMKLMADESCYVCTDCNQIYQIVGSVFEEAQFYSQEGQRAKNGQFNPSAHFNSWLDHVLALEPRSELACRDDEEDDCGHKTLEAIRREAKRKRFHFPKISPDQVRGILQQLKRTELNKNTALIISEISGRPPPKLSEPLRNQGVLLFEKINQARIQVTERANRPYYPYYIYKIYDYLLREDDPQREMLWFIHLPKEGTLKCNDEEWKKICGIIEEIPWKATSRTAAKKWRRT